MDGWHPTLEFGGNLGVDGWMHGASLFLGGLHEKVIDWTALVQVRWTPRPVYNAVVWETWADCVTDGQDRVCYKTASQAELCYSLQVHRGCRN